VEDSAREMDKKQGPVLIWQDLVAPGLFLLLAAAVTYPVLPNLFSHKIGLGGDNEQYIWNLWWARHSIVELGKNPFYTDYLLHPYESGLAFHTYTFLNGLLSIPLQYLMDVSAINNLFVYLAAVLRGLGAYLLAHHALGNRAAAFMCGFIFMLGVPFLTGNLAQAQWMPLYLFFLLKSLDTEKGYVRYAVPAGVMLALNFNSAYYYFIFMLMMTALITCVRLLSRRAGFIGDLKRLLIAGATATPLVLPLLYYALSDIASGNVQRFPEPNANFYVADLIGFITPGPQNPILGGLSLVGRFTGDGTSVSYLGFSAMALAALGFIGYRSRDRRVWYWALGFVFFAVLSLGPRPHVLGKAYGIMLPYELFNHLPVLKQMRVPIRFHVPAMLSLSMLAAYGAAHLLRTGRRRLLIAALALTALEFMPPGLEMHDASVPEFYRELSRDSGAEAVLEVPFMVRDGFGYLGSDNAVSMYYQTVHQKKLLGGYLSRIPERRFWSHMNLPLIRNLIIMEWGLPVRPEYTDTDRRVAQDVVDLFGIDYVVIHKGLLKGGEHDYLKFVMNMKKHYEDRRIIAYKTFRNRARGLSIDAGTERSVPYLMRGWINGQREGEATYAWTTGREAVLLLNLKRGPSYEVVFRMRPHEELTDRRVSFRLNGRGVEGGEEVEMDGGWGTYALRLPPDSVRDGINRLSLIPVSTVRVSADFGGVWSRGYPAGIIDRLGMGKLVVAELELDWSQDNSRLREAEVAVAVEEITVSPALRDEAGP
jgi:hypothetical protein